MTIQLSADDRWDITDALARYCIALDDRAFEDLDLVFTQDVAWEYELGTSGTGLDPLKQMLSAGLAPIPGTQHSMSATQMVTPGTESVSVRSYITGQHVRSESLAGHLYTMGGWYLDEFVQTPDGWRSVQRRFKSVWLDGNPAVFSRR
jgi:hypothetical protein